MKVVYEPRAEVIHLHDETFERVYNRYRREAHALKQIHKEQKFTIVNFFILCTGNIISDWFHAIEEKQFAEHFFEIIRFRMSQFFGTYHGYNKSEEPSNELVKKFYYPKTYKSGLKSNNKKHVQSSEIKY